MDDNNVSLPLSKAAVLVGVGLVLAGIGLIVYLALTDSETAAERALRPSPAPASVASDTPVAEPEPSTSIAETPVEVEPEPASGAADTPVVEPEPSTSVVAETPGDVESEPEAPVAVDLPSSQLQWLEETDVGSGSSEFSAVALDEDSNRLMVADDENRLFEYDLASDDSLIVPPRRVLRVTAGAGDIEGIAWMFDNTYVLAHENDGRLTIVEIADDMTLVSDDDVVRTIDTGIRERDGNGVEGVAYLGSTTAEFVFAVVDERPATLYLLSDTGTVVSTIELDVPDASDVWANTAESVLVLSDEGRVVVDVRISTDGTAEIVSRLSLVLPDGRFEQPEGLVRDRAGTRLYIVGELPGPSRYSFGLWTTEPLNDG